MPRARREHLSLLPALILYAICCVAGQTSERHSSSDPANLLYQHSTFAHGYIHGYEDGFHIADQDYHLGRIQPANGFHEYRDATAGYHRNFGPKEVFKKGYREGFAAGYTDSINNRSFRAVSAARSAADGLGPLDANTKDQFDSGFISGYTAAHTGLPESCDRQKDPIDFCVGYGRGYRFATLATDIVVAQDSEPDRFPETASSSRAKQ